MTNTKTLSRVDAIRLLAGEELITLNADERRANLEMLSSEWDSGLSGSPYCSDADEGGYDLIYQKEITEQVRRDISGRKYDDVMNSRYDNALIVYLTFELRGISNRYLLVALKRTGASVQQIEGLPLDAFSCPCCGAKTLPERHRWDICRVCWWEDDGTDNAEASLYYSGPNKGLQLTEARINFIVTGIYNPDRIDLREHQKPIEHYDRGRIFEIDSEKNVIFEKGTNWYAPLTPPYLKEGEAKPEVSLAGSGMRDWPPKYD